MEHLRHRRAHPRPLASGHDQHGRAAHLRNRRAPGPVLGIREHQLGAVYKLAFEPAPLSLALVPANPLANRVVRDAVFPANREVTGLLDLTQELVVGRALELARLRFGDPLKQGPPVSGSALSRAVPLVAIAWEELHAAPSAGSREYSLPVLSGAMGVKRRCAVGTDDPEVFKPMVIRNSVDVIQDQRHSATTPNLALGT